MELYKPSSTKILDFICCIDNMVEYVETPRLTARYNAYQKTRSLSW